MKRTVRAPRVWAWPLAVLVAFAAVAFVLHGIVGFLLGFVAALVVIDRLLPTTGALLGDAHQAYARQARRRRAAGWRRRLRRAPAGDGHLPRLAGDFEEGAERHALGVQVIEVVSIVGTTEEEKAHGFDDCFRPPDWTRGRWELVWMARTRGMELPPISVYRVGGEHYVRDGHHRVSVARSLGDTRIEADVVALAARPEPGGYPAKR
ncbi:MAG TPA: hypothetical protein VF080_19005 [Solirubrobacteraceae bacterium]